MTNAERLACETLARSSKLETAGDINDYVRVAKELPIADDPDVLDAMLSCLNAVDAGEVQYELIEAAERFSDEVYTRAVLYMPNNSLRGLAIGGGWSSRRC